MRYILLLLAVSIFLGCQPPGTSSYLVRGYRLSDTASASVGESIFSIEYGQQKLIEKRYKTDYYTKDTWRETLIYDSLAQLRSRIGKRTELIYKGVKSNSLSCIYSEYYVSPGRISTMKEQGFIYELQYDLNESKIIAFQSFLIEIIKASQKDIVFHVIDEPIWVKAW